MPNFNENPSVPGLCSSDVLILPDEQLSDFEKVQQGWLEEYQPEGHAEGMLVNEVILNEWALKRARRRLMFAEQGAVENWTRETEKYLKLMQRMKIAAERSFYQALNAMQRFRKDRIQMAEKMDKVMTRNQQLEHELAEAKKQRESGLPLDEVTKNNLSGTGEENAEAQLNIPIVEHRAEVATEGKKAVIASASIECGSHHASHCRQYYSTFELQSQAACEELTPVVEAMCAGMPRIGVSGRR